MKTEKIVFFIAIYIVCTIGTIYFWWFFYSFAFFEGRFSPIYTFGCLSDPSGYYHKHIEELLENRGFLYDVSDIDESHSKEYVDKKYGFKFKYPNNLDLETGFITDIESSLDLINESDTSKKCYINVKYKGWGIGKNWLPRERRFVERQINWVRGKDLYFYTKNNRVSHIHSTVIPERIENTTYFTGALFLNYEGDKFINVALYGEKCTEDQIKTIFSTFQVL